MWSSIWSSIIAIHTWLCAYAFGRWRFFFFFSSRRRHTRCSCDWSSDVCSSDLAMTSQDSSYRPPDLKGRVALVAGATRGVGRGTALALGEAGATVYCTGRSTRTKKTMRLETPRRGSAEARKALPADYYKNRPETIEETAGRAF